MWKFYKHLCLRYVCLPVMSLRLSFNPFLFFPPFPWFEVNDKRISCFALIPQKSILWFFLYLLQKSASFRCIFILFNLHFPPSQIVFSFFFPLPQYFTPSLIKGLFFIVSMWFRQKFTNFHLKENGSCLKKISFRLLYLVWLPDKTT